MAVPCLAAPHLLSCESKFSLQSMYTHLHTAQQHDVQHSNRGGERGVCVCEDSSSAPACCVYAHLLHMQV